MSSDFNIRDIFNVHIEGSEAVFKNKEKVVPIPKAIEIFKDLYSKEKSTPTLSEEDRRDFVKKFSILFDQEVEVPKEVTDIVQRPTGYAIKKHEARPAIFLRSAIEIVQDKPGFIGLPEDQIDLIKEHLDGSHYIIYLDQDDHSRFITYSDDDPYIATCTKNKLSIDRQEYDTFEQFKDKIIPDSKPLEIATSDHPKWETMPQFYNHVEGDTKLNEPAIPFTMTPGQYCFCQSRIPGCLNLVLAGQSKNISALVIPTADGKFISKGRVYNSIEQIAERMAKGSAKPIPFDVQKAIRELPAG
jgi:hypothetical protein